MTSPAGNPNQPASYDMHMLFKPPGNPTPNPGAPQSRNPPFPTPPPPGGPFSYPPQSAPFHHLHHQAFLYPRPSMPYPSPPMPPNVPNHGAHLMALLGGTQPPILESAVSMPPSSTLQSGGPSGEYSGVPPYPAASAPILPTAPSAPAAMLVASPQLGPSRVPSSKQPKGRRLSTGERAVYDVDVRLPGEPQPPQLEVTPITKYGSDPGLVLGRQIAVNRTYICYGLKLGAIRVLNINTALRSLLKGHGQRVSDMAFFADDVHLLASASVDGRIFVWKIDEGPDESDKPQITEKIVIAIQIMTKENSIHPHVCWHCHKQEVLVVGIGNSVLRIDTNKVGKGESFFAEEPLKCHLDKLIDGVQLVGKHDGEVTDLSMSQWMTTRLVSASKDGTIKIWEDRKATPLVIIRPHDGQPVNSVSFLAAPHRPDHIVLITAGPLNREVKVWVSASQEGWLLPSDSESWQCTQTLDLRSSSEARVDDAFFNQVVVLPQASLILLANAKKNAIYAVHVDYGPYPVLTRMDYIAEFMVTMPILSLTGTTDCLPDGEQVVQVYCVQTQAIQQYALDLSQCLPPPLENVGLERDPSISHVIETRMSDGFAVSESSRGSSPNEITTGGSFPNLQSHIGSSGGGTSTTVARASMLPGNADAQGIHEPDTMTKEKHAPPVDDNTVPVSSQPGSSADAPGRLQAFVSPSKGAEQGASDDDHISNQVVTNQSVERTEEALANFSDIVSVNASSTTQENKAGSDDSALAHNFHLLKMNNNITHLITPSEILSGAITSSESTPIIQEQKGREIMDQCVVNHDMESVDLDVKGVGENGPMSLSVDNEKSSIESSVSKIEMTNEYSTLKTEILTEKKSQPVDTRCSEAMEDSLIASGESCQEVPEILKEDSEKTSDTAITELQSPAAKGKKQKATQSQASEPSSSSASPFNSSDSLNEQGNGSSVPFTDASASHIAALQQSVTQLIALQKEMQKQMLVSVAVPVTKEGRRIETSLGRSMEKAVKANVDSLWARMQEDNAKREKLEKDRVQQITTLLTNAMSKDLPAVFEKALKKEFSAVGPAVARAVTPVIEKTVSSAVTECFQRGVGDKAVNQLEKSVNSKLEVTVAKQIQAQFQTSGKQALQEALRSSLESSVIPAFEQSCKLMFEQVDSTFQKGMTEHTSAAQRQFESTHTPLALTLRDAINSASSITQNLTTELVEGQRKVLAVLTSGNRTSLSSGAMQQGSDPLGGVPVIEAPIDPKKELSRLISDQKFEESFTLALQRSDVSIVSWLCSQVDLLGICSTTPLPLSQGVLLALLQQLACDLVNETPQKLRWMTDVAAVVNPADQTIAVHVRPIFEQVYQILAHQRSLPTIPPNEATSIRLLMHVINSVLMSCK